MSMWASAWAWRVVGLGPEDRLVLVALADRADDSDRVVVAEDRLRQVTGLSSSQLRQVVLNLVALELVERVRWLAVAGEQVVLACDLLVSDVLTASRTSRRAVVGGVR